MKLIGFVSVFLLFSCGGEKYDVADDSSGRTFDFIYSDPDGKCVLHKDQDQTAYDARSVGLSASDDKMQKVSACPKELEGKTQTSSCSNEGKKTMSVYYEGYAGAEADEAECKRDDGEWKKL